MNALTAQAGLRVGPIVFETLIRHYLDRVRKNTRKGTLRQENVMYDEVFTIVKAFLEEASYHTLEEIQAFANTRTPAPPWVRVVRLVVPRSCCDEAAQYLITAFGGEEVCRRVVGGVKWWQVRGVNGVDAEWIVARKDWKEAKSRYKARESAEKLPSPSDTFESATYDPDMDEMRLILYAHGGGYYFGSIDQERYSLQRYARKINGRVFAMNYRLAPQYPFPCALQDLIAAYIYLIRPPPEAKHRPVKPSHIVIAGDSAGGGLCLALLQVIRDTDLPLPAGGVLISPWCDLTHSFPSIHTNTATDVIPAHGLSFQKPSTLWPPPPPELANEVHASLRARIKKSLHHYSDDKSVTVPAVSPIISSSASPVDVGTTASLPSVGSDPTGTFTLTTRDGHVLTVDQQLQFYTPNSTLLHPLVSPALSYLGGLPPLLIIASDKEVLRDEIIYAAHKAGFPDRFPIKEEVRLLYPSLVGIEKRFGASPVHLQVYDDTAHVMPLLFPFSTPAKFCYRAIATFCRHVTGMSPTNYPTSPASSSFPFPKVLKTERTISNMFSPPKKQTSMGSTIDTTLAVDGVHEQGPKVVRSTKSFSNIFSLPKKRNHPSPSATIIPISPVDVGVNDNIPFENTQLALQRQATQSKRNTSDTVRIFQNEDEPLSVTSPAKTDEVSSLPSSSDLSSHGLSSANSNILGTPLMRTSSPVNIETESAEKWEGKFAGEHVVYTGIPGGWKNGMIRERVSTSGVVRPLEPEEKLDALNISPELVGAISELVVRRYIDARHKFDRKFSGTLKNIEKHRRQHLKLAKQDTIRNMNALQNSLAVAEDTAPDSPKNIRDGIFASTNSWSWAWVLDEDEHPPPSSIVSRRDTGEARRLANIADRGIIPEQVSLSGNNFWQFMVNFLSTDKRKPNRKRRTTEETVTPDNKLAEGNT